MLGYARETVNCGTRQSAGHPERSNVINPKTSIPGPRRSDAIRALTYGALSMGYPPYSGNPRELVRRRVLCCPSNALRCHWTRQLFRQGLRDLCM